MWQLKKFHLYTVVVLIFIACFLFLNLKYDRYYRLPGITNENRLLIEEYLTTEEKKYLIENCIDIDHFINYIQEPHFKLLNYEYYRQVPGYGDFETLDEMVSTVNLVLESLEENPLKDEIYTKIVEGNLLQDYQNFEEYFDFNHVDLYTVTKRYNEDPDYIIHLNGLIDELKSCGMSEEELNELLPSLVEGYSLDTLTELVMYRLNHPNFEFVRNPDSHTVVLKSNDYLGGYVPKDLVRCEKAKLLSYDTYLRKSAYEQYVKMFNAYDKIKEGDQDLLIVSAFKSQEVLLSEDTSVDEAQLGTTVHLKVYGIYDKDFGDTKAKQWLDDHAYEYGYILRYPYDSAFHQAESYTYRYVGKKVAKVMHDEHLTLEEYLQRDVTAD